ADYGGGNCRDGTDRDRSARRPDCREKVRSGEEFRRWKIRRMSPGRPERRRFNGDTAKYDAAIAKCETKFAEAWQKAIDSASSAGVTCTDAALAASDYKSVIDRHTSNIATALAGGELVTGSCGNGIIDADEDCDFGAPGDQTCDGATAGAAPYGTVSCGAGCTSSTSSCFACPGKNFGGSCWRFGAQGASCTDTCANVGMSYDSATKTFAGSDGTAENCSALAQ